MSTCVVLAVVVKRLLLRQVTSLVSAAGGLVSERTPKGYNQVLENKNAPGLKPLFPLAVGHSHSQLKKGATLWLLTETCSEHFFG